MSNVITNNPLVIDTASSTAVTSGTFVAWMIRWVGATTAGHTASIQDKNGNVRWASEASGANYVEETHFEAKPQIFEGLKVPTLASGIVYIYVYDRIPIST